MPSTPFLKLEGGSWLRLGEFCSFFLGQVILHELLGTLDAFFHLDLLNESGKCAVIHQILGLQR